MNTSSEDELLDLLQKAESENRTKRARRSKPIKPESNSENEDDPQIYESSGDEWVEEPETKQRSSKRASARNANKIRKKWIESESEDTSEEEVKPKKRNGMNKKQKLEPKIEKTVKNEKIEKSEKTEKSGKTETPKPISTAPSKPINLAEYATGSFLILKKDVQVGDKKNRPCIWRVDGKALLQKYEPFEDSGKMRYRTTSVYTGWSALDRDLYAPVKVSVQRAANQSLIVDLDWEQVTLINMDSD